MPIDPLNLDVYLKHLECIESMANSIRHSPRLYLLDEACQKGLVYIEEYAAAVKRGLDQLKQP